MIKINLLLGIRFIVAGIFLVSGTEKLLSPTENFLYVIENYQILPWPLLELLVAMIFPWLELILGAFLLLGLWTRWTLIGLGIMTASFIFVVGQAIWRKLPIESCGCFGELVKMPLPFIVGMDTVILLCVVVMVKYGSLTDAFSLDRALSKK